MRVVLDTNVIASALLWGGTPERLIERLAADLTKRFGSGFGRRNLFQARASYLAYPDIVQTASAQSLLACRRGSN